AVIAKILNGSVVIINDLTEYEEGDTDDLLEYLDGEARIDDFTSDWFKFPDKDSLVVGSVYTCDITAERFQTNHPQDPVEYDTTAVVDNVKLKSRHIKSII